MNHEDCGCPLCRANMEDDIKKLLARAKQEIIVELKKKYPDWDESQGICPKCEEKLNTWFDKF